jgi:2-succinyl-6-hydroxy-2,4-cyclohexadiene-1-carboxylate synthase
MGGRLALHVALGLGVQRVRRLVLIGASPGIEDAGERAARRAADEALADSIEGMSIEAFASRWATETAVLAGQSESVLAFVAADRLRNTPAGLARALRGLGTGALPSLWDRLGELTMPVELIVGERDAKFTEIAMRMVARGLRVATPVEVAGGAGHAVHLEAPRVVASRLGAAERP